MLLAGREAPFVEQTRGTGGPFAEASWLGEESVI